MSAKNDEVKAQEQLQQLSDKLDVIVHDRGTAIEKLHLLATHNLFPDAHAAFGEFETGPWSVTQGVEIAREIDKTLRETRADDDAWLGHQTTIFQRFNELQTSLGTHGHQPQMEWPDDSLVDGSLHFAFMDWRHILEILAARKHLLDRKLFLY
jgi:hypothetical protein